MAGIGHACGWGDVVATWRCSDCQMLAGLAL
jgi:hypothetical protein